MTGNCIFFTPNYQKRKEKGKGGSWFHFFACHSSRSGKGRKVMRRRYFFSGRARIAGGKKKKTSIKRGGGSARRFKNMMLLSWEPAKEKGKEGKREKTTWE